MNKNLKIAIIVIVVGAVLALAFLAGAKQNVEVITYKDYQEIKEKEGYVYYGSKSEEENLKELAKSLDIEVSILDPKDLSKSEIKVANLKEGTLYLYEDNKAVFEYNDELNEYNLTSALVEEKLIDPVMLTITLDDYLKIIKKDGYHFMFIGSETCGYCTQFKDSIKTALKDYNFNVYYLNIASLTEEEYQKLYNTDKYFSENEWGTPLNFLYKDGKRIGELNGYVPANELVKFLKEKKVI